MLRAILFDTDGTLVDSVDLHAHAWQQAFRHVGREISFEKIRRQIGKGSDQIIPMFLSPEESRQMGDKLDEYRRELFLREYLPKVRAFDHTRELFLHLKSVGLRTALASSAERDELEAYKRVAGIEDLVDVEMSAEDVQHTKPAPDVIRRALAKLGNPQPGSVLMVGDTPYDAQAAATLGVRTIGLLCGGTPEEELRNAGCIAIYRDPGHLLANYEESPIGREMRSAA